MPQARHGKLNILKFDAPRLGRLINPVKPCDRVFLALMGECIT
jgi:hypothetical protein